MKLLFSLLLLCGFVSAQSLPIAPSAAKRTADRNFWTLIGFATAANTADAFSTAAYVGPASHCNIEKWSPWLYGRTAPKARVTSIMAAETVSVSALSYLLKRRQHRLWYLPLAVNGSAHAWGAIHNFEQCR